MQFHFEPETGWINDPNGLIFFRGQYHAFYQYNPYEPKWGTMHWGHAVSEDLLHWQTLPIALTPDRPYENGGGCFSGSAVKKDGRLYLFYTADSKELGQTQCMAWSDDGVHFTKYEGNPILKNYPPEGCREFRDPKVLLWQGNYYMVVGSKGVSKYRGHGEERGRVLLYTSADLLKWKYVGLLYECRDYDDTVECPDLFPLEDRFVLCYSMMHREGRAAVRYVPGDFDGRRFYPTCEISPEAGPQYYAPQSFAAADGRRLQLAWTRSPRPEDETVHAGAFTIPRELYFRGDMVCMRPIREAQPYLKSESACAERTEEGLRLLGGTGELRFDGPVEDLRILEDGKLREVFINGGLRTFTWWVPENAEN